MFAQFSTPLLSRKILLRVLPAIFTICGIQALANDNDTLHSIRNATIAFSQGESYEFDSQLLSVNAEINLRAWQKWRKLATRPEHFPDDVLKQYQSNNITLIAGGTASVIFQDETTPANFQDWATVDAKGERVPHDYIVPGAHRASMANPHYRRHLIELFQLQIDAGVDGVFIDEVNAGAYNGGQKWGFNGNEGFDNYFLADFNRYLLAKYPGFTKENWQERFAMQANNYPRKDVDPSDLKNNFNYRHYLEEHGWSEQPLNQNNPLMREWGVLVPNRTFPSAMNFREQALISYWKEIVDTLKSYAREKYNKQLLVTSNGIFPFVDFNSVGLYEYNFDDFDGKGSYLSGKQAEYVPVKNGKLDGSRSLQAIFRKLYNYNQKVAGDVPLVLFIDWPTEMMRNYNNLNKKQREDYWRLYVADAYAQGLRFAHHLKTSIPGDPSAKDKNMLSFFREQGKFYKRYSQLCSATKPLTETAQAQIHVNHKNIDISLHSNPDKSRYCLHLVNHNYNKTINEKNNLKINLKLRETVNQVFEISPDNNADSTSAEGETVLNFSTKGDQIEIGLEKLRYSSIVILDTGATDDN